MTFRETLDRHLRALQQRDLPALIETLPAEQLVLITSEGQLVRSVAEFIEMHRGWFAMTSWKLDTQLVSIQETSDLAVAVLHLDYREDRPDGPLRQTSYLTLVFAREGGKWVMVQDQNTPTRAV